MTRSLPYCTLPSRRSQEQQGTAAGPQPVLTEVSETSPVQAPLLPSPLLPHHFLGLDLASPHPRYPSKCPPNTLTAQALAWHSPSSSNGPARMVQGRQSKHSDTTISTKNPKKGSPNVTVIILLASPQGAQASGSLSYTQAIAKRDSSTRVKCRLSLKHQQCKQPSLLLTQLSHHPPAPGAPRYTRVVLLRERNREHLKNQPAKSHCLPPRCHTHPPWGLPPFFTEPRALHVSKEPAQHSAMEGRGSAPPLALAGSKSSSRRSALTNTLVAPLAKGP